MQGRDTEIQRREVMEEDTGLEVLCKRMDKGRERDRWVERKRKK